jgi:hypothetical protein
MPVLCEHLMRVWLVALLTITACGAPVVPVATPTAAISATSTTTPATIAPPPVVGADPCHLNGQVYCLVNPAVSFATRGSTICVTGWTATVRPPASYTSPLKAQQMAAEHLSGSPSNYEEDHRLPLEGGGFPGGPGLDEHNLSPEPHPASSTKDAAENQLKQQLCAAKDAATFTSLQVAFVSRWLAPWPNYR